jgi:hypothetical protein
MSAWITPSMRGRTHTHYRTHARAAPTSSSGDEADPLENAARTIIS